MHKLEKIPDFNSEKYANMLFKDIYSHIKYNKSKYISVYYLKLSEKFAKLNNVPTDIDHFVITHLNNRVCHILACQVETHKMRFVFSYIGDFNVYAFCEIITKVYNNSAY